MPRSIPASAGPPAYLDAPPAGRVRPRVGRGLWSPSADHRTFVPGPGYDSQELNAGMSLLRSPTCRGRHSGVQGT
eukprot:5678154-Alexandrium_andersonii.AAC.1